MTEDIKTALGILERAMKIEQDGDQFYRQAAKSTRDKTGQEMFTTLAADEQRHYNLIERERSSLISEGKWVSAPEIKPVEIDLDKPLFPKGIDALKKSVSAISDESDALIFGMEIETKSYDLYRQAASQVDDSLGKQMFSFLAGQEQNHFNTLMMRYDSVFGPVTWRD